MQRMLNKQFGKYLVGAGHSMWASNLIFYFWLNSIKKNQLIIALIESGICGFSGKVNKPLWIASADSANGNEKYDSLYSNI